MNSVNQNNIFSKLFNPNKFLFGVKEAKKFDPKAYSVDEIYKNNIWGLIGSPNIQRISADCSLLEWQAKMLTKNSASLKKKIRLANIFIFVGVGLIFVLGFVPLILAIIYYSIIKGSINSIKTDLLKYQVVKKNGWVYDPTPSKSDASLIAKKYSKIFKRGVDQYVDDQVWGTYKTSSGSRDFHLGSYTYVTEHHTKNGTHRTPHPNYFFAVRLDKKITKSFMLYQESIFSKIGQKFSDKEIDVESIEFNKTFAFSYDGKKQDSSIDIVKLLSPSVQLQLLELNSKGKNLNVLFDSDTIIFLFSGKMFKKFKTKLVDGGDVAKEDSDLFNDYLQSFNQIANGIISKI